MIETGVTDDPLTTGWTFTQLQGTSFTDSGTVSGKRRITFTSAASANDAAKIEKTVTGLINGSTSFSVIFAETGSTVNISGYLYADDVLLMGPTQLTSGSPSTLTGTATVSGGQCKITLKLLMGDNVGAGLSDTYDIYSLQLSVSAVTTTLAQGSFTLTGQDMLSTVLRNYTTVMAQGAYTLTGQALTFIEPSWTRATKNTSNPSNASMSSTNYVAANKSSSAFSNTSKS